MTVFIRLVDAADKATELSMAAKALRQNEQGSRTFNLDYVSFKKIPGSPFAYWVTEKIRNAYVDLQSFEGGGRHARVGLQTSDDFRFVRMWWEANVAQEAEGGKWFPFVRGGRASPFYGDLGLILNWSKDGAELKSWNVIANKGGHWSRNIRSPDRYFRPGITWPLRASRLSPYPMPRGSIFSTRGPVVFSEDDNLLSLFGLLASKPFDYLFKVLLGRFGHPEFSIGSLQKVPVPNSIEKSLGDYAAKAWRLKRRLKASDETSRAYHLPSCVLSRFPEFERADIEAELERIHGQIDETAFTSYRFESSERHAILGDSSFVAEGGDTSADEDDESGDERAVTANDSRELLSWGVGVSFGRFDWRLATGERKLPPEPEPFDSLPPKCPGMLPDRDERFHRHSGILVDDPGHSHDLARLVESVLERVNVQAPPDVRRSLRREFFKEHLSQYSKSRRKAPIYWPLSTLPGNYTLWVYYPSLSGQTLYTAVNEFLEPKLKEVADNAQALRNNSNRSTKEEKEFEHLQDLETELKELREMILEIAKNYVPNHDDGVQITAAPLWPLFQHKPWQKVLKDTWKLLEKGDFDWAHLAMNYWPDRVKEKCKTDKSLAIAHGLEDLY